MPTATKKSSALELYSSLKLSDIDAEIQTLESQLAPIQKQITALRDLRRVIDIRDNGKPERKKPVKRGTNRGTVNGSAAAPAARNGEAIVTARQRIQRFLQYSGPSSPAAIVQGAQIPSGSIYTQLSNNDDLFTKQPDGRWALIDKSED